jgi:CDP-glucose 4,6-dehydratase
VWTFNEGIAATAEWYRAWLEKKEVLSAAQLRRYIKLAKDSGLPWAGSARI